MVSARIRPLATALVLTLLAGSTDSKADARHRQDPAPPDAALLAELSWVNTQGPLTPADLEGKFVLLDFWTYCCINCMHTLPDLRQLEEKYPDELLVIGIHSAKFDAERDTENLVAAIDRYEIRHPVVNDSDLRLWNQFGVQTWPTVILLDPEGRQVFRHSGEITFEQVDAVLRKALSAYQKRGTVGSGPASRLLREEEGPATSMRYPGKVLADATGKRLFIADSGHHRIVVTDLEGTLQAVIGTGQRGWADGSFDASQFNDPQGMAVRSDVLYVADTMNHRIRRVDLAGRRVATIAGTGRQRQLLAPSATTTARQTDLASPWALWLHGDALMIAMAGMHQIWVMQPEGTKIRPYAGNQVEDIVDGPLLPRVPRQKGYSSFAQPSGLASDGRWLYVADSEGSSIRAVPLVDLGQGVRTVVGTADLASARLFTYGDRDGRPPRVLLQHPLGIVYHRGQLYVADTYNNKIKVIDPTSGETTTLAGGKGNGSAAEGPTLDEPAGISALGDRLYVADTNNHCIRVIDLAGNAAMSTLEIRGLASPVAGDGNP